MGAGKRYWICEIVVTTFWHMFCEYPGRVFLLRSDVVVK
jgi:hypothetical protein